MRKVRVIRELPNNSIGSEFEPSTHLFGIPIDRLIQDGWLEEVVEDKSLVHKFKEYRPLMAINFAEDLAHIAMIHAVEVAEKAIIGRCPACMSIIEALKKESELNKTKES